MKKLMLSVGMIVGLVVPLLAQSAAPVATLLVVPARQRMIQVAFDMQSLRQAEVVSWRATSDPEAPELYYWNGTEWKSLTLDEFQKGSRLAIKPQKVVFMGLDTPSVLVEQPNLPGVVRFETYDPAVLVNNLDAFYAFSPGEWRLLSKRYSFMLRDVNEKVRQQNRYNTPPPPDQNEPKRPPVLFEKNPAPAEVIAPQSASVVEKISEPEPVPTAPIDVMTAEPIHDPKADISAGTNAVPAAP